jgi:putative ABC transport system permease protein
MAQFLGEAVLVTIAAVVLGAGIGFLALDGFRDLAQSQVIIDGLTIGDVVLLVGGALLVGLVAGAYPAFYLSGLSPITAILNQAESAGKGGTLRRALVTLQFAASMLLIALTIVMTTQIDYMRGRDLGFSSEQVIDMPLYEAANQTRYWGRYGYELKRKYCDVAERFTAHPNVTDVTSTRFTLTNYFGATVRSLDSDVIGELPIAFLSVEESFLDFFKIKLLAGRFFTDDSIDGGQSGHREWVVTRAAAKMLGFTPEEAIGKRVLLGLGGGQTGQVSGVIEDLRFGSLKGNMEPLILIPGTGNFKMLNVRVKPGNFDETVAHLARTWKSYLPDRPFSFRFLDERIDALYRAEQGQQRLLSVFSGLAIFIGVMGVFGLAAFLAERRVKEICVRKILGACPLALFGLLLRDHVWLILVASVVAIPTSAFLSRRWLDDYATRIDLSVWPFVIAAAICLLATLAAVSIHASRAVRADPAKNLRQE